MVWYRQQGRRKKPEKTTRFQHNQMVVVKEKKGKVHQMKATLEKNYKGLYTLNDLEAAKLVIKYEKENDDWTPAKWAEMAIREADKEHCYEVITATATTARNGRVWDCYGDGTGRMDVWIEAVGECYAGLDTVRDFGLYANYRPFEAARV